MSTPHLWFLTIFYPLYSFPYKILSTPQTPIKLPWLYHTLYFPAIKHIQWMSFYNHWISCPSAFILFPPLTFSRMPRHSCCEVRVMQLHDILLLRTSAILPEAISAGGLTPTTDTSLFLTTYRVGSHLPTDIMWNIKWKTVPADGIVLYNESMIIQV